MTVGTLNRKHVIVLVVCVAAILWIRFGVYGDHTTSSVTATETIPQAEHRLQKLRQAAATAPAKEELLQKATAELAEREKGLLRAPTEAQASASLLETLNSLAKSNGITTQGAEFRDKPLTKDYGEVTVTVRFNCDIAQLVNLLAALADQTQILATDDLRLNPVPNDKNKTIQVLLTVSGVVERKLLPEKKGGTLF
jgi:Tfp pilus assembly protein PilO